MSSLPRHVPLPHPRHRPDPRVSVVVPVKDTSPELLRAAVLSAVQQDWGFPLEIVVWDDGSTTDTVSEALGDILRFTDVDRPLRVGGTPDNRGISAARNAACRMARGQWYLWLDSDDTLPTDAVRRLWQVVGTHPLLVLGHCEVIYAGVEPDDHHARPLLKSWRDGRRSLDDPLLWAVFAVHGGLVHRDLFWASGGFDESLRYAELSDWVARVMAKIPSERVAAVPWTTYHYIKRAGSHSAARDELEVQRLGVLRRYGESFGRQVRHRFARRCGETGARFYDVLSDSGVGMLRPVPDA